MISPAWFFSTLAQVCAALLGFIITLAVAIHQLEIREKRKRTDELRTSLIDANDKYNNIMLEIIEVIDLPFQNKFVPDDYGIAINETDVNQIIDMSNEQFDRPLCSKISMLAYRCASILDEISPSDCAKQDNLISQSQITELQRAGEYISDITSKPDGALIREIESQSEVNDISLSDEIFQNSDNHKYEEIDQWISNNINGKNRKSNLSGSNLISISNIFKEFREDMSNISMKAEQTILNNDQQYRRASLYGGLMVIFGIILPLSALIEPISKDLIISGFILIVYQVGLVVGTICFTILTLAEIWD